MGRCPGDGRAQGKQWEGRAFQRREIGKRAAERGGAGNPVGRAEVAAQKAAGSCPMRLHRENWRGHTQHRSAGKAMGGCPGNGRTQGSRWEGDWALPRREIGKKRGWEWGLGKPIGGCSRAATPESQRNGARKGARRKIGKRGMRAAARENCGRRGGTEKAAGTLPRGDGAGPPVSRRRGSKTGQKGRTAKRAGGCPVRQPSAPLYLSRRS